MAKSIKSIRSILISRVDAIGDVVLTIPLLAALKKENPDLKIFFLGKTYTKDLLQSCKYVDQFLNWDELNKITEVEAARQISQLNVEMVIHVFPHRKIARLMCKAKIPLRVGTLSRFYHWWTCNIKPRLSRKNSILHESDLNIELAVRAGILKRSSVKAYTVKGTQINVTPSTIVNTGPNFLKNTTEFFELSDSLDYGFKIQPFLPKDLQFLDQDRRVKIILHPGSQNSARNWPISHFSGLHSLLNDDRFIVFITGTEEEGLNIRSNFDFSRKNIFDLTGKLSLAELMGFILKCDVLVANSTGPLQIAAALGIHAVGIYPPVRPMHPGRWAPRGKRVTVLSKMGMSNCKLCMNISNCQCMSAVSPHEVFKAINKNIKT